MSEINTFTWENHQIKPLKQRIEDLADEHYDKHHKKYAFEKYTVGERRVMLTEWVSQAWREFHKNLIKSELIRKTFRQVGLSLAVDGSEDHELWIKDIPDVQVGDWTRRPEEISNLAAIGEDEEEEEEEKDDDEEEKDDDEEEKDDDEVEYIPEDPPPPPPPTCR